MLLKALREPPEMKISQIHDIRKISEYSTPQPDYSTLEGFYK
jgi:hypothetical protein